jgi:hypothetical protein
VSGIGDARLRSNGDVAGEFANGAFCPCVHTNAPALAPIGSLQLVAAALTIKIVDRLFTCTA